MIDTANLNQLLLQVAAKHMPYHGLSLAIVVRVGDVVPKLSYHVAAANAKGQVVAQGPDCDSLEEALSEFRKVL
jgi:hypothetical protein